MTPEEAYWHACSNTPIDDARDEVLQVPGVGERKRARTLRKWILWAEWRGGKSQVAVAREYGVHPTTVCTAVHWCWGCVRAFSGGRWPDPGVELPRSTQPFIEGDSGDPTPDG